MGWVQLVMEGPTSKADPCKRHVTMAADVNEQTRALAEYCTVLELSLSVYEH